MSQLLGVLPFGRSVVVAGRGAHVLGPADLDVWAESAAGTPVNWGGVKGGRPQVAGHVDKVRVDKGRMFVYGDLDAGTPVAAEARWAIAKSGVFDQLDARLLARPDPLRNITPEERAVLRRHWGEWPTDDAGVIVQSLAVAAVGIAPGAAWLGA